MYMVDANLNNMIWSNNPQYILRKNKFKKKRKRKTRNLKLSDLPVHIVEALAKIIQLEFNYNNK